MKGRKTGGRRRGSINKTTASVKAALCDAFEQKGGVPSLLSWARSNETDFYKLWARLAPQEIAGSGGAPIASAILVVPTEIEPR